MALIDDGGTLHMKWDNGRTLGLIIGEDRFRVLGPDEADPDYLEEGDIPLDENGQRS